MSAFVARRTGRLVAAVVALASLGALAIVGANPAGAADAGVGLPEPVPLPAPPFDYPAGEVCAFPVHVEFPVNEQLIRTFTDRNGRPVYSIITGRLVAQVSNTATGATVERDISGRGDIHYRPDGSQRFITFQNLMAGFHPADNPPNRLLVLRGLTVLDVSADDVKTLRVTVGPTEDLCQTLAG